MRKCSHSRMQNSQRSLDPVAVGALFQRILHLFIGGRSFYVGDVQPGEVKGKYESGVLTLTIPKKDQPQVSTSNRIAIE